MVGVSVCGGGWRGWLGEILLDLVLHFMLLLVEQIGGDGVLAGRPDSLPYRLLGNLVTILDHLIEHFHGFGILTYTFKKIVSSHLEQLPSIGLAPHSYCVLALVHDVVLAEEVPAADDHEAHLAVLVYWALAQGVVGLWFHFAKVLYPDLWGLGVGARTQVLEHLVRRDGFSHGYFVDVGWIDQLAQGLVFSEDFELALNHQKYMLGLSPLLKHDLIAREVPLLKLRENFA